MNTLFYGDNLDVLREHIKDESVDLIYLDPPFNSDQNYNVLFAEKDGSRAAAQIQAFTDTWQWDQGAAAAYEELVEGGGRVADAMRAFWTLLGPSDMMAYLAMMAPRLMELKRVLKSSGTIWLHCDPTASHYLKLLMDSVFGHCSYINEIVWIRSQPKGLATRRFPQNHDVILAYSNGGDYVWKREHAFVAYEETNLPEKTQKQYNLIDESGRKYRLSSLTNPNHNRPNLTYEFLGVKRVWRWTKERMQQAYENGFVVQTKPGNVPQFKRYLDEQPGMPIPDIWTDIPFVSPNSGERLGYPTQKPSALVERILSVASTENGIVLDPFCGCGTTIAAAQILGRQWIGIDITHLAINLIRHRLRDQFGDAAKFQVIGEPTTVQGAEQLAAEDPYQFQWWALGLVGARPVEKKKGADHGIDGRLFFHDEAAGGKTKQVILSVKAGKLQAQHLRDLRGVLDREGAEIGVMISLNEPTGPMRKEAATAGFYTSPWGGKHPRLQLLTVGELLEGKQIDMPPLHQVNRTFKKATKTSVEPKVKTGRLFEE